MTNDRPSSFSDRRKGAPRVVFEKPIGMMAIDGTWCRICTVIDVSDTGAQLCIEASASATDEFFLMLSAYGQPVFRRCKRVWTKGDRMGVNFDKTKITDKTMKGAAWVTT
jgi:PilZ domain-containing protein